MKKDNLQLVLAEKTHSISSSEALTKLRKELKLSYLNLVNPNESIQAQLIRNYFDGRPIKESVTDEDFAGKIIDLLGKWRAYAGATKDPDPEGKIITAEWAFLAEHFGELTDLELSHLIELYARHEFEELEYFNYINFCASFISEVILAFYEFKVDKLQGIQEKYDKQLKLAASVVSASDRAESMRSIFSMLQPVLKNPNSNILLYSGLINIVFDYLVKIKKLTFTPELTEAAKKFAHEKDEKNVNLFARFYCLQKFFEQRDLETAIRFIKTSHFSKK